MLVTQLRDAHSEFERCGVGVATVTFGNPEETREFCEVRRMPFACYADPGRRAYDSFGLERRASLLRLLDPRQLAATLAAGRAGHPLRRSRMSVWQMPGTFLIDTAGEVRCAHRNRFPADNPKVEELLAAAEALSSRA